MIKMVERKTILPNEIAAASFRRVIHCISYSLFYFSVPASSAGITMMEQSSKELGQAFSGAPTNTSDASMVFFNPAAMSQVRGRLLSTSGYLIHPSSIFHNSTSHISPLLGGAPLKGGDGGESVNPALITNFYYVQELTNRFVFGLGVNTPFGAQTGYHSDWKGRYQAIKSGLMTINFNPSLSFKVTEKFSLGVGFNVQYLQSKLTNAIDLGTICPQLPYSISCASLELSPQTADGHVALKGNSVGFGYNFGAFYAPNQDTRLGVSYRSRIAHDVHSRADFSVPDNATVLTQSNIFVDTHSRTSVTLPDTVLFGFSHRLNPQWVISADALWSHWSLIQELRTDFASEQGDDVIDLKWRNTWHYAFGVNYFPDASKWILRTGFAYDQTPVPSSQHRSPRLPDNSRYWLTIGFTYSLLKNTNIHAAYAHLFINDAPINKQGATAESLAGQYSEQADIFGLQIDWRF